MKSNSRLGSKVFFSRHLVPSLLLLTAGPAWSADYPAWTWGAVITFVIAALVLAAIRSAVRSRVASAQVQAVTEASKVLKQELDSSRNALGLSIKRQQQERHRLQERLQQEIALRETAQRNALQSAHHDALTQLPNRTRMRRDLSEALAAAQQGDTNVAVMFVDLDDFKRINDTLGHGLGDELLKQAAARVSACIRSVGTERAGDEIGLARVGGDEFVLLFRDVANKNALSAVAERLVKAFHTPFSVRAHKVQTSISVGIACHPHDGQSADTLLEHADMAMYKAKEKGRDGYEFFSHALSVAASRRLAVESGLRKALEENRLIVHYQPKVEPGSYRVTGAEALVRWQSPENGLVAPANFIEIAENAGLIAQIGEWVLLEACKQQRAWRDAGLPSIQIAVNVSSLQFREDQLLATVIRAINESGIEPQALQLEVTENLFLKNMNVVTNTLDYIRNLGATVAIDDFGTGYSSFAYLRQLPVDAVKIDRSFIEHLDAQANDRKVVQAIIALVNALGLKSVAEGVETKDQSDLLTAMGCAEMQGYAFSPAVDAQTMACLLKAGAIPPDALASIVQLSKENSTQVLGSDEPETSSFEFHAEATVSASMQQWLNDAAA